MPPAEPVLVLARSGRAIAQAARRAGFRPYVIDLFGDRDTSAAAAGWAPVPVQHDGAIEADQLLATAAALAPRPIAMVWGALLDDRPHLIERLSRGRELLGADADTARAAHDPSSMAARLDRLGIPRPAVRTTAPSDPDGWLVKRIGGCGGTHVRAATVDDVHKLGIYWQRRVTGTPVAALVAGDGQHARTLALSDQWPDPADRRSFRFAGVVAPSTVPQRVATELAAAAQSLAEDLGLRGLASVDMLVDGNDYRVLEINPRLGGSLDAYGLAYGVPLFGLHVAACRGALPTALSAPPGAAATRLVYAARDFTVGGAANWPIWILDRPAPRTVIRAGEPACTVIVDAETSADARRLVEGRARDALEILAS